MESRRRAWFRSVSEAVSARSCRRLQICDWIRRGSICAPSQRAQRACLTSTGHRKSIKAWRSETAKMEVKDLLEAPQKRHYILPISLIAGSFNFSGFDSLPFHFTDSRGRWVMQLGNLPKTVTGLLVGMAPTNMLRLQAVARQSHGAILRKTATHHSFAPFMLLFVARHYSIIFHIIPSG